MGEPPDNNDFTPGSHCGAFETEFGTSETPKFVTATINGITVCPGFGLAFDEGVIVLEQKPSNSCEWGAAGLGGVVEWSLVGVGKLIWTAFIGGDPIVFFDEGITDEYSNQKICAAGSPTSGGTGKISWGTALED